MEISQHSLLPPQPPGPRHSKHRQLKRQQLQQHKSQLQNLPHHHILAHPQLVQAIHGLQDALPIPQLDKGIMEGMGPEIVLA